MKGEKELIEKILQTEINIFLSIRDGSALMQHMEDFYYITLLEVFIIYLNIFYFIYFSPFSCSAICFLWNTLMLLLLCMIFVVYLVSMTPCFYFLYSECEIKLSYCCKLANQ